MRFLPCMIHLNSETKEYVLTGVKRVKIPFPFGDSLDVLIDDFLVTLKCNNIAWDIENEMFQCFDMEDSSDGGCDSLEEDIRRFEEFGWAITRKALRPHD